MITRSLCITIILLCGALTGVELCGNTSSNSKKLGEQLVELYVHKRAHALLRTGESLEKQLLEVEMPKTMVDVCSWCDEDDCDECAHASYYKSPADAELPGGRIEISRRSRGNEAEVIVVKAWLDANAPIGTQIYERWQKSRGWFGLPSRLYAEDLNRIAINKNTSQIGVASFYSIAAFRKLLQGIENTAVKQG